MDQVTAVVETIYEGDLRVLTTRYLSECGCEWVVDMWGNVRRVMICEKDVQRGYPSEDQISLPFEGRLHKVNGFWEVHDA